MKSLFLSLMLSSATLVTGIDAISKSVEKFVVKSGLAVLQDANFTQLSGRKAMVLTNPTGSTVSLDLGVDVMFSSGLVDLVGVMGPEHGFRGTAQAGSSEGTFTDEKTGLTVYDAYDVNTTTLITYLVESGADTLVFDIQDVGARFYTYTWAMYDTMVASALSNVTFIVLDRPNPLTGLNAFGPVLNESYASYVGRRPISQAHGMTSGELANMFVGEGWIAEAANGSSLDLQVIRMEGWERNMTWVDTDLPWIMPSPNMPTIDTAILYPGACMFEGTNLSEGRGTTRPFELLGATFTNETWSTTMRSLNIPNTNYRFACFSPTTSKFEGDTPCGLQTYISLSSGEDYTGFDAVYVGLSLLHTAYNLYTNSTNATAGFEWIYDEGVAVPYDIDRLTGSSLVREGLDAGLSVEEIVEAWRPGLEKFRAVRERYLLY